MVESARELFLDQGYASTTVAAIAARASVSADLVYKAFGGKSGVLKAVLDTVVGGDDRDLEVLDRPGPQAMRQETDQRRQLAMFATGITEQLERLRPIDDILRGAAAVDAAAAELRADMQGRQRRAAMTRVAGWILARGPLRDDLTHDQAAAILWTMTSPEVHQMLRDEWSWPPEHYTRWLRDTLTATLLPDGS